MNYPVPLNGVLMLKHSENLKTSLPRTLGLAYVRNLQAVLLFPDSHTFSCLFCFAGKWWLSTHSWNYNVYHYHNKQRCSADDPGQ